MLPANAEGGTRQVSQEFSCNPEASLCPSGLQEGESVKGSLATLACCSAAWGLSSAEHFGGHQPRVLQASTAAEPACKHQCPACALITTSFFCST